MQRMQEDTKEKKEEGEDKEEVEQGRDQEQGRSEVAHVLGRVAETKISDSCNRTWRPLRRIFSQPMRHFSVRGVCCHGCKGGVSGCPIDFTC